MGVMAFEGVVEQGHIKLANDARLPDNTRVVVIVPDGHHTGCPLGVVPGEAEDIARVMSPRLVRPAQVKDFEMKVVEEHTDASL